MGERKQPTPVPPGTVRPDPPPAPPTPAAPAGSGAERRIDAMLADLVERRAIGVIGPLDELLDAIVAQRARAEAAERERDEARALIVKERAGGDADREWLTTERDEARAALAASTEREAGLRALCEEALQVAEAYCPRQRDIGDCASCGALRARLASLAAPEGGTTDG